MSQEMKQNKKTERMQNTEAVLSTVRRTDGALRAVLMLFMLTILAVFPIYYHDYYWDIMESKYRFYWVSAIIREFVAVFSRKKYLILTAVGYVLLVLVPVWFFAH